MDLTGATVAVTGATGFVGRYLVRALLGRGAQVLAVVRNPDKVPALRVEGVSLRRADLGDPDALQRAVEGADAVLQNAGVVGLGGKGLHELVAANVQGTENVFRAAAQAGIRRVVLTSSAAGYRPRPDHHYREDDPLYDRTDRVDRFHRYGQSKGIAEREAWRLAGELGLALSTVRPHSVHGAFDPHGVTRWLRRLTRPPVSAWVTRMALPSVYAGDLAEAVCRILETPVAAGRAYNIAGPPGSDFWDLLEGWREAGGPTPRVVLPVPLPMRRTYDLSRAAADLGWTNRPFVEGLRETLALEAANSL